jgi:hypothetical protein
MTLVSEIITDAYRISNLLAIGVSPTAAQTTEALRYLNRIVKSVFGNEAGDPLVAFPIGDNNINRPSGYPWWNTTPDGEWFVPKNYRLMLNLTTPVTLYLHPEPDDGSRLGVIDVSGNIATNNVTIFGNGRLIESANSIVLNVNSTDSEWFYRADLANWVKYAPLLASDTFPFPIEFDDFFVTLLAMRLNPSYGSALTEEAVGIYKRSRRQLQARYTQNIPARSELGLLRPAKVALDRDRWGSIYDLYDPSDMFDKGWSG